MPSDLSVFPRAVRLLLVALALAFVGLLVLAVVAGVLSG
jgi:hypothetical protein